MINRNKALGILKSGEKSLFLTGAVV